jgi:hypothetical protein
MTGKHNITRLPAAWFIVLGLVFAALLIYVGTPMAAPKQVKSAKPGDCAACHGQEKVFSPSHVDTKAMTYKDCLGCHEKAGPQKLEGKLPGSHIHQLGGITCVKCHESGQKEEEVAMDKCVVCHNADKLAEKTAKVKPENPHTSPHYGTTLDCNLCHHQHKKSENFCAQCHKYDFVVP